MPIDPRIALQVQQPQIENPLDALGKVLQIKNAMAQQPLIEQQLQRGALENQQLTQNMGATKAVNDAYQKAVTVGADGTPSIDKGAISTSLASSGYGSKISEVMDHLTKYETDLADLTKKSNENDIASRNAIGSLAMSARAAGDSPDVFMNGLDYAIAHKAPGAAEIKQLIQSDPTKIKTVIDRAIANSPDATKLVTEQNSALTRKQEADVAKARLDAELPRIAAEATVKQQEAAGNAPIQPAQKAQIAISQANADREKAAQTETARHNAVDEKDAAGRLAVEQKRLAVTTGGVPLNPQQQSIAQKLASGELNPTQLSRYPDKEALQAAAIAINPAWTTQTYATRRAFEDPQAKQSQNLGTISRIVGHIGRFEANSDRLGVSPSFLTGLNLTGLAAATHEDAHAISSELEKLVSGGVGTEGQVKEWQKSLTSVNPNIRKQAVDEISQLIGSQYEGMNQTYKAGVGTDLPIDKLVSPAGAAWMKAKNINTGGAAAQAAAAPQGAAATRPTATDANGNQVEWDGAKWQPIVKPKR